MATQYTLDLSLVPSTTYTDLQNILNLMNPSIGNMTNYELASFRNDLASLMPSNPGTVILTNVVEDASFTPSNPVFDITLTGEANETIFARPGADSITGVTGDYLVSGSYIGGTGVLLQATTGSETLAGGAGDDTLMAGSGQTLILGGTGNGALQGSDFGGASTIRAGTGNHVIQAGAGSDKIWTMTGSDTVMGGSGNATVFAGAGGHDSIYGGSGAVTFVVTAKTFTSDLLTAGSGKLTIDLDGKFAGGFVVDQSNPNTTTITFHGQTITANGPVSIQEFPGKH